MDYAASGQYSLKSGSNRMICAIALQEYSKQLKNCHFLTHSKILCCTAQIFLDMVSIVGRIWVVAAQYLSTNPVTRA
jgi:hypothetical protein